MKASAGPAARREPASHGTVPHRPRSAEALRNPLSSAHLGSLSKKQFERLRELAFRLAGLSIADFKKVMVQRRINTRIAALSLPSVAAYLDYLSKPKGQHELQGMINALTTNKTSFFREPDQFEHLQSVVLPRLMASRPKNKKGHLRVWAAGCSTGEEAWSIAMTIAATLKPLSEWDVRILASDIDTNVLEKARHGTYPASELEAVPRVYRRRFFTPVNAANNSVSVCDELRRMVTFRHFNLHASWPLRGPFDVIFCRNVMIYFNKPSQKELIERFAGVLTANGILYSGHSECLHGQSKRLSACGRSMYRRAP